MGGGMGTPLREADGVRFNGKGADVALLERAADAPLLMRRPVPRYRSRCTRASAALPHMGAHVVSMIEALPAAVAARKASILWRVVLEHVPPEPKVLFKRLGTACHLADKRLLDVAMHGSDVPLQCRCAVE